MPNQNDSAWYYMNVYFVESGNYIHEERHPSFDAPSQLYPFFGYSFFIYSAKAIAGFMQIDWPLVLKLFQYGFYLGTAYFIFNIIRSITKNRHFAYITTVLYFLYYTFFNFSYLVMSETLAIFLFSWCLFLFHQYVRNSNKAHAILLFTVAGYAILVKPVFALAACIIILLFCIQVLCKNNSRRLAFIMFIILFPLFQIIFSKTHYNNYKINTGLGWHLWNKVIWTDKLVPENSESLDSLRSICKKMDRKMSYGPWWDVSLTLSQAGYTENQIDSLCRVIAIDAIRENPFRYFFNTFPSSYYNVMHFLSEREVYESHALYEKRIYDYSHEPQHKPLTNELQNQRVIMISKVTDNILALNHWYALHYGRLAWLIHNPVTVFVFFLSGIYFLIKLISSRFVKFHSENAIWMTAFLTLFGSNLFEYPQYRLMVPSLLFIIVSLSLFVYYLNIDLSKKKI